MQFTAAPNPPPSPAASCAASCSVGGTTQTCEDWVASNYACTNLEDPAGPADSPCDCSGCDCGGSSCTAVYAGLTCDDLNGNPSCAPRPLAAG